MSEIQVNSIKSLSGPLINLQSDILATGKNLDVNKIYLQSYSTSSYNGDSNSQKLVTSKYYVDDQLNQIRAVVSAIGGSAGAGLSGIAALSAGLSAEGAAIRAESDSKYLFRSKFDTHSGGGLTFSGGPYKFTSGSPVVFSGSSVGVGAWFSSAANTPLSTLHVSGADARITIQDTTFGTTASFQIMAQTNNTTKLFRIYDVGASPAVDLLCIKPDGNVGIGNVQSPLAKLHVKTASIGAATTLGDINLLSKYSLVLDATNANGSGTTPTFNGAGIAFAALGSNATQPLASIFYGGDGAGGSLHFATATTYANSLNNINMSMRNGNVGVGTTTPATRLHVLGVQNYGSAANSGILTVGNAGNTRQINFGVSDSNSVAWIEGWVPGTGGSHIVLQPTGGSVGIGTATPSVRLEIAGSIRPTGGTDLPAQVYSNAILVGGAGSPDSGRLIIGDNSGWKWKISNRVGSVTTDLVTFMDTGNVGIGVASPTVALDISGAARSSTSTTTASAATTLTTKDYVDSLNFSTGTYAVYALVAPLYGTAPTASARGSFSPPYTTATTRGSGVQYTSPVDSIVHVQGICDRNSGLSVIVGGKEIRWTAGGNIGENFNFIVPPNTTYKVTAASGIGGWTEFIS